MNWSLGYAELHGFFSSVDSIYVDFEFPGLEVIIVSFKCMSIYSKFVVQHFQK